MRQKTINDKIRYTIGGINSSNLAQHKKLKKVVIKEILPPVPTSDLYYRYKGVWQYKGKICRLCGVVLADAVLQDKHQYICKQINKKSED